jgi:hypothetical protein
VLDAYGQAHQLGLDAARLLLLGVQLQWWWWWWWWW